VRVQAGHLSMCAGPSCIGGGGPIVTFPGCGPLGPCVQFFCHGGKMQDSGEFAGRRLLGHRVAANNLDNVL